MQVFGGWEEKGEACWLRRLDIFESIVRRREQIGNTMPQSLRNPCLSALEIKR